MNNDAIARERATDPKASFIVQAPAGSGKTELLTQRYLRLLAGVEAPEQIIALTFTRKAANEMRQRIIGALSAAFEEKPFEAAHQRLTREYAKKALERDKKEKWHLLQQPSRLRILTIDALCQSLTTAIPLKEKQTPFANVSEKAEPLYHKAAFNFFNEALTDASLEQALGRLLEHLDNRQEKLLQFLEDLLKTREQWIKPLFTLHVHTRLDLEKALQTIEAHEIQRFLKSLPLRLKTQIQDLSRQLALIENDPESPRFLLSDWLQFDAIDKPRISALASMILTKADEIRKSFDHHVGLRRDNCPKILYAELKQASLDLFAELANYPDFIALLIRLKDLPTPHYEQSQWDILQALLTLLPYLLAHLQLVFNEANLVDFSAILQQALEALGTEEEPTDLALYLDYSIHHLLIDEFQDTSINQFQLLQKLVQGWLPNEGKTLFIVGDPMQSIYRFRQAEVGLFLKARLLGIGPVALEPLELSLNFRSTKTLVHWVNTQFQSIFPAQEDMETGAVCFHQAVAALDKTSDSKIEARQYPDKAQEALGLIAVIEAELSKNPEDEIAILVRSRGQLRHLMPLLREKNIPFQGVEIEQLSNMPHLQDLWTLTKALLMPANRLYWLAFLRSPWAGLSLADLEILANWDKKKSLLHALANLPALTNLSQEGYARAAFLFQVLNTALERRHQLPLIDWVIQTTTELYAENILSPQQQDDLEQFWSLLDKFVSKEGLPDLRAFEAEFKKLYSKNSRPSKLQIMTIHKSKGLEFDTLILPALGKKSKQADYPLIRWLKLPEKSQSALTLVSPVRAAHQDSCPVYNYLGQLDAEKEQYELQRLLYVALTRAKKRIYLFDNQDKALKGTFRSMLAKQIFQVENLSMPLKEANGLPVLKRLPQRYYENKPKLREEPSNPVMQFPLPSEKRQVGIIAHELLQWICNYHPLKPEELPWAYVGNQMKQLGFNPALQAQTILRLKQQMATLFKSQIGLWICKKQEDEQNEYELLVVKEGVPSTQIIDRTFTAEGSRWIIDFKTGAEDARSQASHRKQVEGYAAAFRQLSKLPIRCGLYYLSTDNWVEWAYEAPKQIDCALVGPMPNLQFTP